MGVTLERVQNKFACIIGELCSEPVVLSQFAIWLDLRLAEYKAKGAISLECSGEHPDPSWLQGHIRVPPPPRIKPRVTAPVRSNRKNHTPSKIVSHTQVSASVRSPADVIVVKEEPTDYVEELGIFPVSLHKHDNWRKRTAPETAISDREFLESDDSLILQQGTSSTPKVRRVEGIPAVSLEPVSQETESLISIIAGESQLENSNSGDLTESVKMEYSNQERQHDQSGDNSTISLLGMPIASTSSADSDTLVQFPETEGPDTSNTDVLDSGFVRSVLRTPPTDPINPSLCPHLHPDTYPEHLNNAAIRQRIVDIESKTQQCKLTMVKTVATLERWLWSKYGESRPIETMPPSDLDEYLCHFWPIFRKKHGGEYEPDSFSTLRCILERFLREHNYPSISRSIEFNKSQQVFIRRRRRLHELVRFGEDGQKAKQFFYT